MNSLPGYIEEITTEADISLVKILVRGQYLYSFVLVDTPGNCSWLKKGHPVKALFKETEVIVAKKTSTPLLISVRNQLHCRISGMLVGNLLCELTMDWPGASGPVTIRSVITRSAWQQLALKENDEVIALIKTNEVSLAYD